MVTSRLVVGSSASTSDWFAAQARRGDHDPLQLALAEVERVLIQLEPPAVSTPTRASMRPISRS